MKKEKYTDEQIDSFLNCMDIELLPYQREFFKKSLEHDKVYIVMPPNIGRTDMSMLMEVAKAIVGGKR